MKMFLECNFDNSSKPKIVVKMALKKIKLIHLDAQFK